MKNIQTILHWWRVKGMREKRNFLQKILGLEKTKSNQSSQQTVYKILNNFIPTFSKPNKNLLLNDSVLICIDTIAKHCAKFEPKHCQNRNQINGDINYLLSNQPNPIMTTYDFIYRTIALLYTHTNTFVYIDKDEDGFITGFYPVSYTTAEWLYDTKNNLYLKFWLANGNPYILPYGELIHLRRFYIEDELIGSGNLSLIPALNNLVTTEDGISNAIKLTSALRGIIKYNQNLKEEDIKKNKENFVKDFLNIDNEGIAALDNKAEFKELNLKPVTLDKDQLDHIEQRVLNYFNLNQSIISGKFTTDEWNAFYETVLEPLAIYLEQSFKMKIFSKKAIKEGHTIAFSVNRVQYASTETKIKIVKEVGAMGILTIDQALTILDLPPIGGEDGKKRMQSLNYINSSIADIYQLTKKGGISNEEETKGN